MSRRNESLACSFLKTEKCALNLEKCPDRVRLWVKFLILNAVLRVTRKKNSEIFPCGAFLSHAVVKMFIEVPLFQ